eukprot:Phypoly_transcript_04943.p1 GENE.Phypoly_transcript_04943~~Phypoly_transcript_04943.p1  ORF type:complete len:431 (+),score=71.60 Phypoly_transcript_04943:25-1293(+)
MNSGVILIKILRNAATHKYLCSRKCASIALLLARQYSTEEHRQPLPPPPPHPPPILPSPPQSVHPSLAPPVHPPSTELTKTSVDHFTEPATESPTTSSTNSPINGSPSSPDSSTDFTSDSFSYFSSNPSTDSSPYYSSPYSPADPSEVEESTYPSACEDPQDDSAAPLSPSPPNTVAPAEGSAPESKDGSKDSVEIKDPVIIFNTVWNKLEVKYGRENLRYPQEIIWLGGAPGAGKGTNTPFIASVRGITAAPIVMSSLLDTPEARKIKSQGGLVSDSYVVQLILEELMKPIYRSGVVVDGFPRTTIQVECTNMLYAKMLALRKQFYHTPLGTAFARPVFRVTVLFIEEIQSIERQMKRGKAIQEQNKQLMEKGLPLLEERDTDMNEEAGRKRCVKKKEEKKQNRKGRARSKSPFYTTSRVE